MALGRVLEEVLRHLGEVSQALPQRRQANLHDSQAETEILAEVALLHHRGQVAVGGGDHAHIHLDGLIGPHPDHFPLLQRTQQVRLGAQWHVANLIEKERALVRGLEAPLARGMCTRKCAALMAEELTLEHPLRQRRAVEWYEGRAAALARLMQRPRDEFLAGARLTRDEHRRVGVHDLVHHVENTLHGLGAADQSGKGKALVEGHVQRSVLPLNRDARAGGPHRLAEDPDVQGLLQVVQCPFTHRRDGPLDRAVARHDHHLGHRAIGAQFLAAPHDLQAVEVLEAQVGDNQLDARRLERLHACSARARDLDPVSPLLQDIANGLSVRGVVLDDQDVQRRGDILAHDLSCCHEIGSRRTKSVPFPASEAKVRLPPCSSAMRRAVGKPKPLPPLRPL